jgi:hypothetical protein
MNALSANFHLARVWPTSSGSQGGSELRRPRRRASRSPASVLGLGRRTLDRSTGGAGPLGNPD